MEEVEEEENEVFEITDFTTSSDWERFIARLEEVLHEWKLDDGTRFTTRSSKGSGSSFTASTEKVKINPIPIKKSEHEKEGTWAFMQEEVSFATFTFNIAYHYLKSKRKEKHSTKNIKEGSEEGIPSAVMDMFDMDFDFPPRVHCLSRWFGLKEFIVLTPAQNIEAIDNESRCHLLLSSIAIAFSNAKCTVPMFIQASQRWRRLYYGVCLGGEFRTSFEMCHLKSTPPQYDHLAGLLEVFKDKLACSASPCPPVTVSVRFTYILDEWTDYAWPQEPPDLSSSIECEVGMTDLGTLPFGATQDPISELHLSTTWPCLSEEVVVDNAIYSDLDPLQAPEWSVRVRTCENPHCLLGEYIGGYMNLCYKQESTMQLLNTEMDDSETADITQALQKLTDPGHGIPVTSLSSAVSKATTKIPVLSDVMPQEYPIPEELLNQILMHLFPDAEEDIESVEAKQQQVHQQKDQDQEKLKNALKDKFRGLKSAPEDSLTYFLAVCICIVYNNYGGLRAVAHLWHEFVLEMRYRWENDVFIPRLKLEPPDLGYCLIHQKLQMLNCCIERRRISKMRASSSSCGESPSKSLDNQNNKDKNSQPASSTSSSDDDEFFEAVESLSVLEKKLSEEENNFIVKGRLRQCGDLRLLACDEPLYIPITQEPAPMTEDMLQEHAEVLSQLGTTQEGARVRAQMQSASLLSDMEAFKAANPGCLLGDFVRWYSPNDWIPGKETTEEAEELKLLEVDVEQEKQETGGKSVETPNVTDGWEEEELELTEEELEEEEREAAVDLMNEAKAGHVPELKAVNKWMEEGHLSLRMRIPGNIWAEVWHSAKPIPIRRQKRLFDETKEAEKVLHSLAALKPSEVAFHLFPVLLHAVLLKIEGSGGNDIPAVSTLLDQVTSKASKLHWLFPDDLPQCEELVKEIQLAELVISRAKSLRYKFRDAVESQKKKVQMVGGEKNLDEFLASLMEKPEVTVIGAGRGPAGRVIHKLFAKQENARSEQPVLEKEPSKQQTPPSSPAQQDFPRPAGREYILRTTVQRPSRSSRPSPQRIYCVLAGDEFRLAGAFTEDVIFQ
ncbi:rab3 GTPase-activating protein catalytic subunit-like [Actinia tenebrosa]|uniref:Rab3 GTPase-activating protein catalytic subunit n=1 Tax=Actinia tenebrosa TaxID=6105 RepID=A0A6P8IJG9_ACTTE|nr:rab3 GTPase-activating protein catalytic subunit-like [Actinia tenebrosa]